MTHDKLTCLVPTHNRPHFLRRLFRFYAQFPPGFPFLVVDSSHSLAAAENREVIDCARRSLEIGYRHFDLNCMDKCVRGLEIVESPFVVFCADDDYLFSDAVWRCAAFLENQPGFASAMGRSAMLNVKQPLRLVRILKGYSVEDELPFDRCHRMVSEWFSNFYAVYRTETLLDNFRITAANSDSRLSVHLPESLMSQLSVLRGRVKVLPLMYSLREQHGGNGGAAMRNQRQPQAEPMYQRFRECLTEQLERAGIGRAEAERFVDDSYGRNRYPDLANRRQRRSPVEAVRRLLYGITERTVDFFWTERTRHRRLVRASDFAGCETQWHAATQLIRDFPQGIASEPVQWKRCG